MTRDHSDEINETVRTGSRNSTSAQPDIEDAARARHDSARPFGKPNGAGGQTQLAETVGVFRECLALKDNNPVYVTLGTVAANLLPSRDPVWTGLIGPPSSAKTELLNSLSHLACVHVLETFTPAGLLSGTPNKDKEKGATGGVLRKIGDFGIMLFKDFGSVIELRTEQRSEMMAALRRIYDGEYTRQVGAGGGKTLKWNGKAGCLFGATQAYDQHHAVSGTLGDRFLLYRIETKVDEQLRRSRLLPGAVTDMRQRLASAVADLFASLPDPLPEPTTMSDPEYASLSDIIRTVIKLRCGVMRDRVHREIDDVLDPEGPARLALALQQLFAGLFLIGVNRPEATVLVEQIAYDSVPKLRLKAFNVLTDNWQKTRDVANAIKLPTTTTKRALEDLMAQGLALRDVGKENGADDDLIGGKKDGKSGGGHRWKRAD
jgi:hypothetical protein